MQKELVTTVSRATYSEEKSLTVCHKEKTQNVLTLAGITTTKTTGEENQRVSRGWDSGDKHLSLDI